MAVDRAQAQQEFQKYFNREMTEQDFANAEKYGTDIFKKSYESINQPGTTATSQQEGQGGAADLTAQEAGLRQQRIQLTQQKPVFTQLLQQAVEQKRKAFTPYNKREKALKKELFDVSPADYKDLAPQDALRAMGNKYSTIRSELSQLDSRKQDIQTQQDQFIQGIKDGFEAQLTEMGLRIEDLGFRREMEQDVVDLAFDPTVLMAGVMPSNLPPQYQDAWKAASEETRRQQQLSESLARRSGGGGRARATVDPNEQFRQDAGELILAIDSGELVWGTAFDFLKSQYPDKSNEEIDRILGGGMTAEGEYTGRAKPGYYEGLTGGTEAAETTDLPAWAQ